MSRSTSHSPASRSTKPHHTTQNMSAMSANMTAAPSVARPAAALRRAGGARRSTVVRRGVVAEAIKEPSTLNTTKSDQVRVLSLSLSLFHRTRVER